MITAWNPASQRLPNEVNWSNNQRLAKEFNHNEYTEVFVGDEHFCWVEESFAVGLDQEQALEVARKYGQNAIYYVRGDQLFLLSCNSSEQACIGDWRSRCR